MKRIYLLFALVISACMCLRAGITTYTFTSVKWASQVGSTKCDGKTDGWTSDKDGGAYDAGRLWADKKLHGAGVSVQTGQSGAGATSVKSFTNIRQITFNLCQNASNKGQGVIYVQIGDADPDSMVITNQKVTDSEINRDSVMHINPNKSGKIRFWVTCTKNAIHINTITIRAEEGGTSPFTQDSYQLVTDIHSLCDSDQVIFGVADNATKMIMGYYDETISQNNIHAIKGAYNEGRTQIAANDNAIYTLRKEIGETSDDTVYIFEDELRYGGGAYLVASGGRTKNKLTLWDDVVSPAYGNYGFWRMTISSNGEAAIENAGTSSRKYMQYNSSNTSFGCYEDPNSQTKVCLYHLVKAIGTDDPAIAAGMVNFGIVRFSGERVSGERKIEVNANKLKEDISCSLKHGDVFSLGSKTLDRDGDNLVVRYSSDKAGKFVDTLVLTSTGVTVEVSVMVDIVAERSIAQVCQLGEYEFVYLNPVTVTKKYDKYVFIRDESGSMLIWDATNPSTGKPYAQNLENGHVLTNVQGRFRNFYGVPELTPTAAWTVGAQKVTCNPEMVTDVDSADVCRYVRIEDVTVLASEWQGTPVVNKFNTGIISNISTTLDAIVMIDHDEVQLWVVKQSSSPTAMDEIQNSPSQVHNTKLVKDGQLYIRQGDMLLNAQGQMIK